MYYLFDTSGKCFFPHRQDENLNYKHALYKLRIKYGISPKSVTVDKGCVKRCGDVLLFFRMFFICKHYAMLGHFPLLCILGALKMSHKEIKWSSLASFPSETACRQKKTRFISAWEKLWALVIICLVTWTALFFLF